VTIGVITYNPSGQFNLPRSYVYFLRFYVQHSLSHVTKISPVEFTIDYTPVPSFVAHVRFLPEFMAWNSNVYSLDHIITDSYYDLSGSVLNPLNLFVGWASSGQKIQSSINIVLDLGVDVYEFPLDAPVVPYWLPPPIS
jgi:hypothetical protein